MKAKTLIQTSLAYFVVAGAACRIFCCDALGQGACAPVPTGLVGWWPGNGNADDIAGGDDGTPVNGATYGYGEVGEGFELLSGYQACVLVTNTASLQLQDFTIECWIQRGSADFVTPQPASDPDGCLFGFGPGGYVFALHSDGTLFLSQTWDSNITGLVAVTDTLLHHVAVTTSGGFVVFYLDGVAYPAGYYAPTYTFSGPAAIGAPGDFGLSSFYGFIDELSVYDNAISSDEIESIYAAGSVGKCADNYQPTPAPELSIQIAAPGFVLLSLAGVTGVNYEVDSSSDLVNWMAYTNVAGPTWSQILPSSSGPVGDQFFRASINP